MDDWLLKSLDRDAALKKLGRSAVMRHAVHLHSKRRKEIAEEYRRAYGGKADDEFKNFIAEQKWPGE